MCIGCNFLVNNSNYDSQGLYQTFLVLFYALPTLSFSINLPSPSLIKSIPFYTFPTDKTPVSSMETCFLVVRGIRGTPKTIRLFLLTLVDSNRLKLNPYC